MAESTLEMTKIQIPLNKELLDHAHAIREQWQMICDRLKKIEESKGQVSDVVYRRVHMDYAAKQEEIKKQLLEVKQGIDHEFSQLATTKEKITKELETHRHMLDEITFRNSLGEFETSEFEERLHKAREKLTKFETIMTAVNENMKQYEAVFEGIENFPSLSVESTEVSDEENEEPLETDTDLPIKQMLSRRKEPETDEAGYILEEEGPDYFSATPDKTDPGIETSQTAKASAAPSQKPRRARVVLIDGTDAGAIFAIQGTMSLGRAESNTIMIKDAKSSRQHSQIVQKGTEYVLVDLNSSNGTFVNGERVEEHVLSNGDEIQIGDTHLQFQG